MQKQSHVTVVLYSVDQVLIVWINLQFNIYLLDFLK